MLLKKGVKTKIVRIIRNLKILRLKNIPYNHLITPEDVLRGKPFNDSILYAKKKYHIINKDIIYVGDFEIEYNQ